MPTNNPAKTARNAALFSGVVAAAVVVVGVLIGSSILIIVLACVALFLAIVGVMIWARRARDRDEG